METEKRVHPCPQFIGAQVRYFRNKKGFTQKDLSEASEVKLRHLQEIEAGRVNVKLRTLGFLSLGLGIFPHVLLTPVQKNRDLMCSECQHMLP